MHLVINSVCTKVAFESDVELSVCFKSTPASNCKLSTQSAFAKVPNAERFVCPTTLNEINTELSALSITVQRPAFAPLTPAVFSQETINASHVFHVNSVTAIETIHELAACSVPPRVSVEPSALPVLVCDPVYELSFCPVSVSKPLDDCFVFPATVPVIMNALPVLSVSTLPRSRSMQWSSVSLWWSSIPLWWSSALPWWSSASSAKVWWSSASLWWSSAPPALPWRSSAPSWSSVLPALPQSPVSPLPHGPCPPSLPLFRLRSTALLDCIKLGMSGSRSLGGGGGALSRIRSMNFRSLTTRGHSLTTLSLTPAVFNSSPRAPPLCTF